MKTSLPLAVTAILVLWVWTLMASDAPRLVITGFWFLVGAVITLWVRRDLGHDAAQLQKMASSLESALERNEAEVYEVRATAFVEFEEIEDEGASYAFELGDGRLLFISGQEFYGGSRFPSLDFSLVYPLNEDDLPVDLLIERRGAKASPTRTVPAAVKDALNLPEHLTVLPGPLDDLEAYLR